MLKKEENAMKTGSIYVIKNTVNDKVYVGQTTMTVHERFAVHMKPSTQKQKSSYKLYNAIAKYGTDKFYVETLESGIPIEQLDKKEIEYIYRFDSFRNGYNSTKGGDGRVINKIENEDEVLQMAINGVTAEEIGKKFSVNKATVFRTLHKLGFYYHVNQKEIIKLVEAGMTNKEIAETLGCHSYTVTRAMHRCGMKRRNERINKRVDFDYDVVYRDYVSQMPMETLCAKYQISRTVFHRCRKERGLPVRPQTQK